jgi:hypothetical protein
METIVLSVIVIAVVAIVALTELAAAVLPILVVVLLVPADQRADLARVLAAADSSHRLRLWRALRAAVVARRSRRTGADQVRDRDAAGVAREGQR